MTALGERGSGPALVDRGADRPSLKVWVLDSDHLAGDIGTQALRTVPTTNIYFLKTCYIYYPLVYLVIYSLEPSYQVNTIISPQMMKPRQRKVTYSKSQAGR